jgi:UDP-sugar pyrophosphorylase
VFRAVPSALGVSARNQFDVNSLTVPRKPGEAVGGICLLKGKDGSALTINVEYNQLDPLLRATVSPAGDVPDTSGFSPYPGNINVLVFRCAPYLAVLDRTGGNIPEFVNPKYADAAKNVFKKPTRLECMMQDYPKLLVGDAGAKVGFTQMERFICFSAVKNNPKDALDKLKGSGFAESASTGEADIYAVGRYLLKRAGVSIETEEKTPGKLAYLGIPFPDLAKVVLAPSFGTTIAEVCARFPDPQKVSISARSSLVVEGDVIIKSLILDGNLVLRAEPGKRLLVDGLVARNKGVVFDPVDAANAQVPEAYRVRGFVKRDVETLVMTGNAAL